MRKSYDKDFKLMLMKLLESGQKVSKLSEEYNVNAQTIYRWEKEYKNKNRPAFTGNGNAALIIKVRQIVYAQEIENGETKTWTVEVTIDPENNGTYRGVHARHEWQAYAGLDAFGNDPDSGWVGFEIY